MIIATALLLTLASGPTPQTAAAIAPATADQQSSSVTPVSASVPASAEADARELHPLVAGSVDGRRRIEVRFGGWPDGTYSGHGGGTFSGAANGAFGFEYLSFLRNDLAIGVGFTSLVRADACGACADIDSARAVTSIPFLVRWYPARRLTRARTVEPYATAGIGPVFGVDTTSSRLASGAWSDGLHESTNVGTTLGGRVGGGFDFRLGRTFTLGVGGAWNWDSGFSDDLWRAPRPSGGEFTMSFGWNFGR
jgi:hypothetical protein